MPLYLVLMDPSKDWLAVPLCFHTSCMISVVKWVPRSELTLKGSPNLEKMWFINRQAFVSSVSPGAGRHSICYPVLTVARVLESLFGGPTMERSFFSFAVVLVGLDLPVVTGNTPGFL